MECTVMDPHGQDMVESRARLGAKMEAAIFVELGRTVVDDKPVPDVSPLDALIRITTTV
jgi:alcohol dehydrogenase